MPIDIAAETLLSVGQAARAVPYRPNVCTVWRWLERGVRGVRLESVLMGGRRFTSQEALERFFTATTAAANGTQATVRTPHARQKAIDKAKAELAKSGI